MVRRSKGNTETSHLWWLPVLFHSMGCRLHFFLYYCTATKLGNLTQLLPIHSLSSRLSLVQIPVSGSAVVSHLPPLFDGAPVYQKLLTKSYSLIWAPLWDEWSTSPSQQFKGLEIIIWDMEELQTTAFFSFLVNYPPCTHPVHWDIYFTNWIWI